MEASILLLSNFLQNLSNISNENLSGLKAAVSLALYSAGSHDRTVTPAQCLSYIVTVHGRVILWVARQFRIPFQIQSQHQTIYKTEEIEVK